MKTWGANDFIQALKSSDNHLLPGLVHGMTMWKLVRLVKCQTISPTFVSRARFFSAEASDKDTFGTIASSAVLRNEQQRETFDGDDHDGELEFEAKIVDVLRPGPKQFLRQINEALQKGNLRKGQSGKAHQ